MPPKYKPRPILWLWLTSILLPLGCKTPDQESPQESRLASTEEVSANHYLATELRHLFWVIEHKEKNCTSLNARVEWTPSAIVGRLYQYGLEKPPSPKAELGHQSFQKGGYLALRRAFFIAAAEASEVRDQCHQELIQLLDAFTRVPVRCFEFDNTCPYLTRQSAPDTSNRSLELTWLMSNLIRAATILEEYSSQAPEIDATNTLTRFKKWAGEVLDTYVGYGVFAAGISNRKASQIETLLRYSILTKNAAMIAAQKYAFEDLLTEVKPQGELCEDVLRDKFHPQFFVASALNIAAILQSKTNLTLKDLPIRSEKNAANKCAPIDVPFQVNPDDEEQDDAPERDEHPNSLKNRRDLLTYQNDAPKFPKNMEVSGFSPGADEPPASSCTFPPNLPACRRAAFPSSPEIPDRLTSLQAAIAYTAESNLNENPPQGYDSSTYQTKPPQNWRPAYNIPTWYLAARYFLAKNQSVPTAVQCMLQANYFKFNCSGRYDLNKSWGYSAIADRLGI